MSGFFVFVTGSKNLPINIGRERFPNLVKPEWVSINQKRLCREGGETPTVATEPSTCGIKTHKIKVGEKIYDLGLSTTCEKHVGLVPTLDQLKLEYRTKYFKNIYLKDKNGDILA